MTKNSKQAQAQEALVKVFDFASDKIPTPNVAPVKSNDSWIRWGLDNLYPYYLHKLFDLSATHSSIINHKAKYIIGAGTNIDAQVNAEDTFEDFLLKVTLDYLLYGAYAVEVEYNTFNKPVAYHQVPLYKLRWNLDKNKFWYSDFWEFGSHQYIFDRFSPINADSKTKIFLHTDYSPTNRGYYPQPEYNGTIKAIHTDLLISDFNFNNINGQFSLATLITFFSGSQIDEKKRDEIYRDLQQSYTGTNGKKWILDFQSSEGKAPEVTNISANDWHKALDVIKQSVKDDIMTGHSVGNPMLFSQQTEGKLGGAGEYEVSYQIFKKNYVNEKRDKIAKSLSRLFQGSELVKSSIEFKDEPIFDADISEDSKMKILTINEQRAEIGYPAMVDGDRLISEIPRLSESVKDQNPKDIAVPTEPDDNAPTDNSQFNSQYIHLTDEDFEKIKDMGLNADEFEFVLEGEAIHSKEDFSRVEMKFDDMQEIADYMMKNKVSGMSLKDIRAALRKDLGLNISTGDLKDTLENLTKSGVLSADIQDGVVKIQKPQAPKRQVQVMYSYQVRKGLGEPIIATSRPFCKKLIENNRIYTREEIQTMASIFGYDIFSYGGGYYHNPETDETTTHCRHEWVSKTVIRKK